MNEKQAKSEIISDLTKSKRFFTYSHLYKLKKDSFKKNGTYSNIENKDEKIIQYK